MRILYISQYFPPEAGATQARSYEMAKNWVALGHSVIMIAEIPNHPSGVIRTEYKGKFIERSDLDGIDVIRVWVKTSPVKNFVNRMFFYLSFMINAVIVGIVLCKGKFDFIYATSPPLFVGASALILSKLKRTPLVFEVRDLWPESAVALGELNSPIALRLSTRLEEACYRNSHQVVVVTQETKSKLIRRGIPEQKLLVIPNGANVESFFFLPQERECIREELQAKDKFILVYAGIHGIAQDLETIIDAAVLLRNHSDVIFLFIGEGPKKAEISKKVLSLNVSNVLLLSEKPRDSIPAYLSAADVAVIPLRQADVFRSVVPSKLFDAWACERPVLISIEGEARDLVESVQGGIFVSPGNPQQLADIILHIKNSRADLVLMGKNGREYTVKNHSREALARKLITHLQEYFNEYKTI